MLVVTEAMIAALRAQYRLDFNGLHGIHHWQRVHSIGARLAAATPGADIRVLELFAYLHDACRFSDGRDLDHGQRAVALAQTLRGRLFQLEDAAFAVLCQAMEGHTRGDLSPDPTIGCCWDADRLDLGRVGIRTRAELLSTAAAREPAVMEWGMGLHLMNHGQLV